MKAYMVVHTYGVDGGFGDYISQEDVIATFVRKVDAERFAEHFANPHVYDRPYAELDCGTLKVRELDILDTLDLNKVDTTKFWWMKKEEKKRKKETEDEEYPTVYEDEEYPTVYEDAG